jgi:hypothetical protein
LRTPHPFEEAAIMIIPQYWAEARLQHREGRRRFTVRRFGWSDTALEDAQAHAEQRVREAMDRILAGEALNLRERRVAYNGSEGVPIREEVVERDGETVITRNGYGALCLNTPKVLFADIDFAPHASSARIVRWSILSVFAATAMLLYVGLEWNMLLSLIVAFFASLLIGVPLPGWLHRGGIALRGGSEKVAMERLRRFLAAHSQWRVRVYRTPAGLRLLALHRLFDPREAEVGRVFDALGVDPNYARMCRNQNCFRARVSPKPWRMGMQRLRPPYTAAWRPEHAELPARRGWIADYDRASVGYASCRFLETLGSGATHDAAEHVQQLHDLMCQSERDLPLA